MAISKYHAGLCSLTAILLGGCFSPAGPQTPKWNPDAAADACMKQYDTDSSGSLEKKEYSASPALAKAVDYLDEDKDKKLSRDEILARIKLYQETRMNTQAHCLVVTKGGQPIMDAQIEFVPEDFLKEFIVPARGEVADETSGVVLMQSEGAPPDSVQVGLYRVKVTSPSVKIKPEYNEVDKTPLGIEISGVTTPGQSGNFKFEVKTQ